MSTETPRKRTRARLKGKVGRPKRVPDAPKEGPLAPERVYGSTGLGIPEERAQRILCAVEAGIPITQICREFSVSHHTVQALVRNRPELMAKATSIIRSNWAYIAMMSTSELAARLADMKDLALSTLAGIATDKNLLMAGSPTQRVEHSFAPAAEAWGEFVAGLRKRDEVIDVAFEPVGTEAAPEQKANALPPTVVEIETEPLQ
jgi:hypothetical protein